MSTSMTNVNTQNFIKEPLRPLFILQHHTATTPNRNNGNSFIPKNDGNIGVTSLTFLQNNNKQENNNFCSGDHDNASDLNEKDLEEEFEDDDDDDGDNGDNDDDDIPMFQCRSRFMQQSQTQYLKQQDNKAINQATTLTFSNKKTLLASCHANGEAYIWDLNKRRVAYNLISEENSTSHRRHQQRKHGPGLAIGRLNYNHDNDSNIVPSQELLFYHTRDDNGTITIHHLSNNESRIVDTIECHSRTFCKATSYDSIHNNYNQNYHNLIATPSRHESVVSLYDVRVNSTPGQTKRPIGVFHGAGLDLKRNSNASDWRKEGMVMSIKLCDWNSYLGLGCGMESGSLYFHDLRKFGQSGPFITIPSQHNDEDNSYDDCDETNHDDDDNFEFISHGSNGISLGKNPILSVDMYPSFDETIIGDRDNNDTVRDQVENTIDKANSSRSLITIAGMAADAADLLDLQENERGTVAVLKATLIDDNEQGQGHHRTGSSYDSNTNMSSRIKARIRARVGTCKLSQDASYMGKPGVGICRFRPDGKVFAVGGWDRRVRIYSRTSAKLLSVLRGPNEDSLTALDWAIGDKELVQSGVLAAGSGDGKIALWRAFS